MEAPGAPGIPPTWTSSDKDMVGASLGPSRLWFTVGHGIVNEVYWPRVDIPQIRDLGFIVADGKGFWSEVKRGADHTIATPGPGIPAVQILHRHSRFELALRIAPDPDRDVLLIELDLTGDADLAPYALLAPHLGGTGNGNRAEVFTNRGRVVLCAEQGPFGLALAAADPGQRDAWRGASAGYVGTSDGWQDFARNGAMTWAYGLQHEHQSPNANCDVDWPEAYSRLGGPPNNWSQQTVDINLRPLLASPRLRSSPYDRASNMHYALPSWVFRGGVRSPCYIAPNETLSDGDKEGVRLAYPGTRAEQNRYLDQLDVSTRQILAERNAPSEVQRAIEEAANAAAAETRAMPVQTNTTTVHIGTQTIHGAPGGVAAGTISGGTFNIGVPQQQQQAPPAQPPR